MHTAHQQLCGGSGISHVMQSERAAWELPSPPRRPLLSEENMLTRVSGETLALCSSQRHSALGTDEH